MHAQNREWPYLHIKQKNSSIALVKRKDKTWLICHMAEQMPYSITRTHCHPTFLTPSLHTRNSCFKINTPPKSKKNPNLFNYHFFLLLPSPLPFFTSFFIPWELNDFGYMLKKTDQDIKIIVNLAKANSGVSCHSPNLERTNPHPSPSRLRKAITIISKPFQLQARRISPLSVMTSCQTWWATWLWFVTLILHLQSGARGHQQPHRMQWQYSKCPDFSVSPTANPPSEQPPLDVRMPSLSSGFKRQGNHVFWNIGFKNPNGS